MEPVTDAESETGATLDEVLARARSRLVRVAPSELETAARSGALVVDVRTAEQRDRDGDLPGAVVIDLTVLEWRLAPSSLYREIEFPPTRQVILVCNEGYSSSLAAARLIDLGLDNATDLVGGFQAWKLSMGSTVAPDPVQQSPRPLT